MSLLDPSQRRSAQELCKLEDAPARAGKGERRGEWALTGTTISSVSRVAHFFREGAHASACGKAHRAWAASHRAGSPSVIPQCAACRRVSS